MPSPGWHSDPGRPSTLGSLKNDLSNKPVQGNQSSPRQKISQSDALPSVDALPSPTTDSETVVPESASSDSEVLPPWVPTAAGAAAGGAAAVGAILTMAASGVRPR
ncbi:MAG: hypothetical protein C0407_12065, partial [Desulfobacca sp.]|nr:hypothetical protein [Desulfobacca sp.]